MTSNDKMVFLSANDIFKSQYQRTLHWAALTALLCTALMVWYSPQYAPQPYQLRTEIMEIQDVEVISEIPDPPQVLAAPIIHPNFIAAAEEDPDALDTIELPEFNFFANPSPTFTGNDTGFVASSTKPQLVSQAKPHYPEVARLAQVEGTVMVKVFVDVDGKVTAAEIVVGVHPLLNKAALKAARLCVFQPGQQRERKVATWVAVPYNFRLR